jgi:hypothetical protein
MLLHDFKHYCSAVAAALSKWQHCGGGTGGSIAAAAAVFWQHCGGSTGAAALGRQHCGGSKLTLKNYERLSTKERDNSKRTRQQQKYINKREMFLRPERARDQKYQESITAYNFLLCNVNANQLPTFLTK